MESNDYGEKSPAVFKLRPAFFPSVMTTGDIIRRFGIDFGKRFTFPKNENMIK